MKTIKKLNLILLILLFSSMVYAQDCKLFFPDQIGSLREMTSYDKKDRITGKTIQEILNVEEDGNDISLTVKTIIKDADENEISNSEIEVGCENGVFKIDMSDYLGDMLEAYQSMEIEMEGDNLSFPSNISVGDKLDDSSIDVRIINNGIQMMQMNIRIFNREVLDKEKVTTDAGTFDCFRISYDMESSTRIITVKTSSLEWIAEDVGVIRTETYNKRGKLSGYSELTKFEK